MNQIKAYSTAMNRTKYCRIIIHRAEKNGLISKITNYSLSETFKINNYR